MAFRTRKGDGRVTAVVGGQMGSEGKGTIVNHLANEYDVHVRTGGPNAGHSFKYLGETFKHQSLPCGWTNPEATLALGAGALVNPAQLLKEIELVEKYDPYIRDRIIIDTKAMLIEDRHHDAEGGTGGELHARIGSTGEGVGAARIARVSRDPSAIRSVAAAIVDYPWMRPMAFENVAEYLLGMVRMGNNVLLEGTQGSELSLIHGPWPYVTSHDTNAAQQAADCGIAPHLISDTILVVRSHPIRVAGNSGPLRHEISWDEISDRLGKKIEERTTVTNKVRRVGEWDEDLVQRSVTLNDPHHFALTFADYINPEDEGKTEYTELSRDTFAFVQYLEQWYNVPVNFIGTGGPNWSIIDRRSERFQHELPYDFEGAR